MTEQFDPVFEAAKLEALGINDTMSGALQHGKINLHAPTIDELRKLTERQLKQIEMVAGRSMLHIQENGCMDMGFFWFGDKTVGIDFKQHEIPLKCPEQPNTAKQ